MNIQEYVPALIMGFGVFVAALGVPWIHDRTIVPLQERGYIASFTARPSRRELITGAGPSMSLVVTGALIFFLGLLLKLSHG